MLDYSAKHTQNERRAPIRATDSGCPIPSVAARDFCTTSAAAQRAACDAAATQALRAGPAAGRPASLLAGYNIVHGGAPMSNNAKFECFDRSGRVTRARAT